MVARRVLSYKAQTPRRWSALVLEDWLGALVNLAVGTEYQIARESTGEPAIVCYGNYRAFITTKGMLQTLGTCKVEVVSWFIKQEHGRSGQF